jgi:hypothetical protein
MRRWSTRMTTQDLSESNKLAVGRHHKNQHLAGAEHSAPDDGNSVCMPPPTSSTKNLSALDATGGAAGRDKSVHDRCRR